MQVSEPLIISQCDLLCGEAVRFSFILNYNTLLYENVNVNLFYKSMWSTSRVKLSEPPIVYIKTMLHEDMNIFYGSMWPTSTAVKHSKSVDEI